MHRPRRCTGPARLPARPPTGSTAGGADSAPFPRRSPRVASLAGARSAPAGDGSGALADAAGTIREHSDTRYVFDGGGRNPPDRRHGIPVPDPGAVRLPLRVRVARLDRLVDARLRPLRIGDRRRERR